MQNTLYTLVEGQFVHSSYTNVYTHHNGCIEAFCNRDHYQSVQFNVSPNKKSHIYHKSIVQIVKTSATLNSLSRDSKITRIYRTAQKIPYHRLTRYHPHVFLVFRSCLENVRKSFLPSHRSLEGIHTRQRSAFSCLDHYCSHRKR